MAEKLLVRSPELPKHQKWASTFDVFDIKLVAEHGLADEGSRILFVVDAPHEDNIRYRTITSGRTGAVFDNVLKYVRENYTDVALKDYYVFNYRCFNLSHAPEAVQEKAHKAFVTRLNETVNKYKPDCVVFLGSEPLAHLGLENFDPRFDLGRVRTFDAAGRAQKFIYTLPLSTVGTTNPKEFSMFPMLIGLVCEHVATALRGRNLYNIQKKVDETEIVEVNTLKDFKAFYKKLCRSSIVACDTEGENLNRRYNNKIQAIQFFLDADMKAYFIPMLHKDTPFSAREIRYIKARLKRYFEYGESKYLIFHNAKYDCLVIRSQFDVRFINHRLYDTMAGEYCLDENRKFLNKVKDGGFFKAKPYSLEFLERKYGFVRPQTATNKENRGSIKDRPLAETIQYATIDAISIYYIHLCQRDTAKRRGPAYKMFLKSVVEQISDMLHVFIDMEHNGTPVDKEYLLLSRAKTSTLHKMLDEINDDFKKSPAAQKVNTKLLKMAGAPSDTLWGETPWVFKVSKPLHRHMLFFEELKLKPVTIGEGGMPKTDKGFQKVYGEEGEKVKEVVLLTKYNQVSKLINTYINGIWKMLIKNEDAKVDNKLRATYNFVKVITGRAGAEKPGFQQIPSRGKLAKLIKRQFIAPVLYLLQEFDYSAHEVRCWGNIAGDKRLCTTFRRGLRARQRLRTINPRSTLKVIQELKQIIEVDGDIHTLNYEFFFGRRPKDKAERNSVKEVVFGVIYGKGAKSLSANIKGTKEEAQKLIDKLYKKFKSGGDWIKQTKAEAQETCKTVSPLGRVRHLWGYMHWDNGVNAAMDRRGPNSKIQGTASDMGFTAGRNMQRLIWQLFVGKGQPFTYKHYNAVHDSNKGGAHVVEIPITMYLQEHAMTSQVHKKCREIFDFHNYVDYEGEGEVGPCQSELIKWDYSLNNTEESNATLTKPEDGGIGVLPIIRKSLQWQKDEMGYDLDIDKIMAVVEHNARIIDAIRRKELDRAMKSDTPAEEMLLTPENSLKLGLIFGNQFDAGTYSLKGKKAKTTADVIPFKKKAKARAVTVTSKKKAA